MNSINEENIQKDEYPQEKQNKKYSLIQSTQAQEKSKVASSQQLISYDKPLYSNNTSKEPSLSTNIISQEDDVLLSIKQLQSSLQQESSRAQSLPLSRPLKQMKFQHNLNQEKEVTQEVVKEQYKFPRNLQLDNKTSQLTTQSMENVHILTGILNHVSPSSLNRLELVSKQFYKAVVEGQLWRKQCEELSGNLKNLFLDVDVQDLNQELQQKLGQEYDQKKLRHLLFKRLHWQMCSHSARETLISESIASTSQERSTLAAYHTIHGDSKLVNHSYWSSQGYNTHEHKDGLQFRLGHPLCLLRKVSIQPFIAQGQNEQSNSNPKKVQFKIGGASLYSDLGVPLFNSVNKGYIKDNKEDLQTQEYLFEEGHQQQTFHVHNIICRGGFFETMLIDSNQREQYDGQYYVCIQHIKVTGLPLLNFTITEGDTFKERCLKYIRRDLFDYVGGYFNVLGIGWTSMLVMAKLRDIIHSSSKSMRRSASFCTSHSQYLHNNNHPTPQREQPYLHELQHYYRISPQEKLDFETVFAVLSRCLRKVEERANLFQDRSYLQNQMQQIQSYREIPESCKLSVDMYVCQLLQTQIEGYDIF